MSRTPSTSTGRPYGLARVARVWGIARATVYRHRRPAEPSGRPGPIGAMSDGDLAVAIRDVIGAGGFHGEGYRKVWARLRFAGVRTSRRRVLRLMREHGLLAFQRLGAARGPRAHDGTIITERIDTMWGSTVIELKTDLRREEGDVLARLPDYLADAAARSRSSRPVTGIATAGATFFSAVAMSASIVLPRLHSSTNAAISGERDAAAVARGCSAATAT